MEESTGMDGTATQQPVVGILPMWQLGRIPVGFRFQPTDEELITDYLKIKNQGCRSEEVEIIAQLDVCNFEPMELPQMSIIQSDSNQWYFFSVRDRKYVRSHRRNRATRFGFWKPTGKDRKIIAKSAASGAAVGEVIGMKKSLVYHKGRAPTGKRTGWIMHEYRVVDNSTGNIDQDAYVLYRLFKKSIEGDEDPNGGVGSSAATTPSSSSSFLPSELATQGDTTAVPGGEEVVDADGNQGGVLSQASAPDSPASPEELEAFVSSLFNEDPPLHVPDADQGHAVAVTDPSFNFPIPESPMSSSDIETLLSGFLEEPNAELFTTAEKHGPAPKSRDQAACLNVQTLTVPSPQTGDEVDRVNLMPLHPITDTDGAVPRPPSDPSTLMNSGYINTSVRRPKDIGVPDDTEDIDQLSLPVEEHPADLAPLPTHDAGHFPTPDIQTWIMQSKRQVDGGTPTIPESSTMASIKLQVQKPRAEPDTPLSQGSCTSTMSNYQLLQSRQVIRPRPEPPMPCRIPAYDKQFSSSDEPTLTSNYLRNDVSVMEEPRRTNNNQVLRRQVQAPQPILPEMPVWPCEPPVPFIPGAIPSYNNNTPPEMELLPHKDMAREIGPPPRQNRIHDKVWSVFRSWKERLELGRHRSVFIYLAVGAISVALLAIFAGLIVS